MSFDSNTPTITARDMEAIAPILNALELPVACEDYATGEVMLRDCDGSVGFAFSDDNGGCWHFHRLPEHEFVLVDVKKCQRCERDHKDVVFRKLSHGGEFTHWASCPMYHQPILMDLRGRD